METERDIISSEAKLSAIAGLLFFAPFVKNRINFEDFSDTEKNFVYWYVQVWYLNMIFFIITLIAAIVNFVEYHRILSWIVNIWSFAIYIISEHCNSKKEVFEFIKPAWWRIFLYVCEATIASHLF